MERKFYAICTVACFIFTWGVIQGDDTTERNFTEIYDQALWGRNEEGIGYSGRGSDVSNAKIYMEFLQNFLKVNNINSVVDVGCGDWTFSRSMNWEGIHYLGYDIVKSVVERNSMKFASPSINFIHGNAIYIDLPEADLLICKDVLQHLSNEEIFLFLNQIHKFKYCLITNDIDLNSMSGSNQTIVNGGYRTLDLAAPPFNVFGISAKVYQAEGDLKQVFLIIN